MVLNVLGTYNTDSSDQKPDQQGSLVDMLALSSSSRRLFYSLVLGKDQLTFQRRILCHSHYHCFLLEKSCKHLQKKIRVHNLTIKPRGYNVTKITLLYDNSCDTPNTVLQVSVYTGATVTSPVIYSNIKITGRWGCGLDMTE